MTPGRGPYDAGYEASPCFWGSRPGSLILQLEGLLRASGHATFLGWPVLDLGCGEGKNAAYLARQGAQVEALDVSAIAIRNARSYWDDADLVSWSVEDARTFHYSPSKYRLVVAYGLLHCLETKDQVESVIELIKMSTLPGGFNVVCSFNARYQELEAHPGFFPCLLPHHFFVGHYTDWDIIAASDRNLSESHPHNNIPHVHSLTRLITRKPT